MLFIQVKFKEILFNQDRLFKLMELCNIQFNFNIEADK